jgi:hypothetical protein
MPERNPAAFAGVGSGRIHELACVSELVGIRIVRWLAGGRSKKQWRECNPDYFFARRILDRGKADRALEPLRLPPPLSQLPWDIAQFEFGGKGTDFMGVLGTVLSRGAQSQFEAYLTDSARVSDTLPPSAAQSQIRPVAPSGCGDPRA